MANPEAGGGEELQNVLQQEDDSEEDQANMIAAMAGMQMGGQGDHGPMTEQEIADMRMAAQLQDKYVQRAQRE